ncbi:MAG: caspase family protein [Betaproteobacteria bacterium]|nr:caspase family protein [Betaproteobacteria bacterium]
MHPSRFTTSSVFRAVLYAAIGVSLLSCGGNYTKQVSTVTGTTKYLNPNLATQKAEGFETLQINDHGVAEFKMTQRLNAPEFEAPVVQTSQVEGKHPNPIGTSFGTVITIGLYPLLAPKAFFENTVGHQTSEQVLSTETDKSKEVATKRFEWVTLPLKTADIEIQGLGKPIRQSVKADKSGVFQLDLSAPLMNWLITNEGSPRLRFVCLSCTSNVEDKLVARDMAMGFEVPPVWRLIASNRRGAQATWAADRGILGDDTNADPRSGRGTAITWREVFAEVQRQSERQLRKMAEIPRALVDENNALLRSKPSPDAAITRDEFESKEEFDARLRSARLAEQNKVTEFNRQVEALDKKIRQFQSSVPKTLSRAQQIQVINETMSDLVGDPVIKSVAYDPDIRRFIVKVAGARQTERSDVVFTMVTSDEVRANEARELKPQLFYARVFVNLALSDKGISPASAQLAVNNRILEMRYVDKVELPVLETVRLESGTVAPFPLARKIDQTGVTVKALTLTEDPEAARMRERLNKLREDISEKQSSTEKDRMRDEIRALEGQLKKLTEGDFVDDLKPLIAGLPARAANGNMLAMVTGIAEYAELPSVSFADRSAQSFADLVQRQYGITPANLILLTNQDATGVRWMGRLQTLARRATENDKLIVYYAGHGAPTPSGKTTILVPQDSSANIPEDSPFRLSEVYKILLSSRAKQILVVLDTCFSGRTDDNSLIFKDVAPVSLTTQSGISPPADPRMTVLTGGGPNDFANALRPRGHRLFTYHLLKEWARTGVVGRDRYAVVIDAVAQDAYALKPAFEQRPLWIGSEMPMAK